MMPVRLLGRRAAVTACALLLPAGTACTSATETAPPDVQIETPLVWAGSRVVLTSVGFTGSDTLPVVLIGADTVAAQYVPPDSLVLAVPDTQGTFAVHVAFAGRAPVEAGTVQLAGGFADDWGASPIGGHVVPWQVGSKPTFAAALDVGLGLVDPSLQSVTRVLPDSIFSIQCIGGTGPAAGGRVTVSGLKGSACSPLIALRPDSPAVAPDTGPLGMGRFAAQLGSGRWLIAQNHNVLSYRRDAAGIWVSATTAYHVEEPYGVAVSPSGDRAVVLGRDAAGIGIPVFAAGSAEPAYLLTGFYALLGAQFSQDGDTLFVVGPPASGAAPVVAALAASSGTILKSAPAWSGVSNLILDPGRPWLYLVGHASYWSPPAVQVVDRATLEPVALLTGPPETGGAGDAYPIMSSATRRLYIVDSCSFCTAGQVHVFSVDLMP